MGKRFMQFVTIFLAAALCIPVSLAARSNQDGDTMIRVGLASSSAYNSTGELVCAHLQNNTGYGAGFRFGYYDSNLNFVELGRTSQEITEAAVIKTQNLYYGYVASLDKYTYSDSITSGVAVGCYHIQIPGSYSSYERAASAAEAYDNGFVAWINGAYQVRVGAYLSKDAADSALAGIGQGTVVGTSSYGMSVVETGTDHILFQFDEGSSQALGILPDVTGADDVRTWFSGFKYRGGFTYQRVSGGNITVVNVVELEDYVKGVVPYEMGRNWPLEALKAQAICARSYVLTKLNSHSSLGFDVCNSDHCQVYNGVGSQRTDYGPTEVSDQAVDETAGEVLWYKNTVAETYFSSSHGGASENAKYIWGSDTVNEFPYLRGVIDPYEQTVDSLNAYSPWTVTYTAAELEKQLQKYGFCVNTSLDHLELTYSELGNVIEVKLCYANGQSNTVTPRDKYGIRSVFSVNSIHFTVNGQTVLGGSSGSSGGGYTVNSSASLSDLSGLYTISGTGTVAKAGEELYVISGSGTTAPLQPADGGGTTSGGTNEGGGVVSVSGSTYVFNGAGWGHSVGMSQYGAYAMAKLGFTYDEIVEFYFPGTRVGAYH